MEKIADALVEAVMFIAYRDYAEDATLDEFEDEDVEALEALRGLLAGASEGERASLAEAVGRALHRLPPGSDMAPYYRAWMDNMFGEDEAEGAESGAPSS
jgi:hypothetical protein